jgi:hypothetical protein
LIAVTNTLAELRDLHQRILVAAAFRCYLDRVPTDHECDSFAAIAYGENQDIGLLASSIRESDEFRSRHPSIVYVDSTIKATLTARQKVIFRLLRDLVMKVPC